MRIVWSPQADDDLLEIWGYLASHASDATADQQVLRLVEASRILSDWPQSGRSRNALMRGMRSIVASPYLIFYQVSDDVVQIVRVLHGRRDIEAAFTDKP